MYGVGLDLILLLSVLLTHSLIGDFAARKEIHNLTKWAHLVSRISNGYLLPTTTGARILAEGDLVKFT